MINKKVIEEVEKFVFAEAKRYDAPSTFQIEISKKKGQELASKLNADENIVYLGTLLMDCQLGLALKKAQYSIDFRGKLISKHVEMSAEKAEKLLSKYSKVTKKEKENIIACVRQHHGVDEFYSLEAEICCNADCYRFASVEGFLGGLRFTRDMEFSDLIELLSAKADEKWDALSLTSCKKELEPQYKTIKKLLALYQGG
jgi:hypothetical protein